MSVRSLLVVNPSATTTTPRVRDVLCSALTRESDLTMITTEGRGHASELAAKAAADGVDVVIALGGDGTVNEVVNGLLQDAPADRPAASVPALGIVPGGSTNVLARALGLPRDPVEATGALLAALRTGDTRTIGLGRLDERWFTFSAGLGLDAEVVEAVERQRAAGARSTATLWVRTAVRGVLVTTDRRVPAMTVQPLPDGEPVEGVFLLIVSNTVPWTYLGARAVNPNPSASFDGGLDALAVRSLRVGKVLRTAGQMLWRTAGPSSRRDVRLLDAPAFRVDATRPVAAQVDGDAIGMRERATFTSVPEALRVLVPAAVGEGAAVTLPRPV